MILTGQAYVIDTIIVPYQFRYEILNIHCKIRCKLLIKVSNSTSHQGDKFKAFQKLVSFIKVGGTITTVNCAVYY